MVRGIGLFLVFLPYHCWNTFRWYYSKEVILPLKIASCYLHSKVWAPQPDIQATPSWSLLLSPGCLLAPLWHTHPYSWLVKWLPVPYSPPLALSVPNTELSSSQSPPQAATSSQLPPVSCLLAPVYFSRLVCSSILMTSSPPFSLTLQWQNEPCSLLFCCAYLWYSISTLKDDLHHFRWKLNVWSMPCFFESSASEILGNW